MTRLFRSKSCGLVDFNSVSVPPPPTPFFTRNDSDEEEDEDDEEEYKYEDSEDGSSNPLSTPFISSGSRDVRGGSRHGNNNQFAILDILVAALRKSLVTCSVDREDVSSMDISWPTDVRHVSHVTFDRFNGFLGLPTEFEPEVPRKVPSASASVFGVSAKSMQCSYDDKGNSVPTILLMMQRRLYVEGGLKAEGIFRINAENSQEESVREQLNKGVVPREIDVHCLAGLIKAWFRELPSGVLDSLTPEQVMKCNTEDDCTQLVKLLPVTESALLQWAINLMADVVEHEQYNKMNARNIAMVFAPNMTQMADPLTALIHAVQVMNLLKTLIMKTLRERDEAAAKIRLHNANSVSPKEAFQLDLNTISGGQDIPISGEFLRTATMNRLEHNAEKCHSDFQIKHDGSISDSTHHPSTEIQNGSKDEYETGDWLSLKKGVRRLCRHPVFQLSKPAKKTQTVEIVNNRSGSDGGAEETWA